MKKAISVLAVFLALVLSLAACGGEANDPWSDAEYTSDTILGVGSKTVTVEVAVEEHLVTFTLKTDATVLGDALFESGLCVGDEGPYGLYIKTTNGILADYDINQRYWAFYINGEFAMSGVDSTEIVEGTVYRLSYEK